nr:hypothetical protein [Tanacetum cinerariifolium]
MIARLFIGVDIAKDKIARPFKKRVLETVPEEFEGRSTCADHLSNQQMKRRRQFRVKIKIQKEAIISKANLMSTQSSQVIT